MNGVLGKELGGLESPVWVLALNLPHPYGPTSSLGLNTHVKCMCGGWRGCGFCLSSAILELNLITQKAEYG